MPPLIKSADALVSEDRVRKSGLPRELQAITLDGLTGADGSYVAAVAEASRVSVGEIGGLLVTGGAGRGKTTIAAAAAWALLAAETPLAWVPAGELRRLVEEADFDADSRKAMVETLGRPCGLVVEDIEEIDGKRARSAFSSAVAMRIQRRLPLVITTDLPPDGLEDALGEKVASRLLSYCEIAELVGPNLHKQIARRRAA